jgi:plastocyanin
MALARRLRASERALNVARGESLACCPHMHIRPGFPTLCALAAAAVWSAQPAARAPDAGRILGTVTLVSPGAAPLQSGAYPSRRVTRPAPPPSELANVVVSIQDPPASAGVPVTRTTIAQRDESFVPRVAAITRGSTVEFPNRDAYFHNVFSLSRGASFDLGRYPRGESRSRTFARAGLVKVYCHLHSDMSATIVVFDHPFYAVPSADGSFALDNVPAGRYRLSAWHERIGENLVDVDVTPGGTAHAAFVLPIDVH